MKPQQNEVLVKQSKRATMNFLTPLATNYELAVTTYSENSVQSGDGYDGHSLACLGAL